MEACAGAHHWGRELQSRGYTVKLIPPQFVKPYVKSNKSDAKDAEAICEAMSRPNMRFVTVPSFFVVTRDALWYVKILTLNIKTLLFYVKSIASIPAWQSS
jgi:hypothetical protein